MCILSVEEEVGGARKRKLAGSVLLTFYTVLESRHWF